MKLWKKIVGIIVFIFAAGGLGYSSGTTDSILIDQDTDNVGLEIDSEATSATKYGIKVVTGQGAHAGVFAQDTSTDAYFAGLASGGGVASHWFYRNKVAATTNEPVVFIEQDNAGDDQKVVLIQQDAPSYALDIDQNGNSIAQRITTDATSNQAMYINSQGQNNEEVALFIQNHASSTGGGTRTQNDGTGVGDMIDQNGDGIAMQIDTESTTKAGLQILGDGVRTGTDTASLVYVRQDSASASGTNVELENDGTGVSLLIDHDGSSGYAMEIDSESDDIPLYINQLGSQSQVALGRTGSLTASNWFFRNVNSGNSSAPVVMIEQDHASDDQQALKVQQDGSGADGVLIDYYGDTGKPLFIYNRGTGHSIRAENVEYGGDTNIIALGGDANASSGYNWFYRNLVSGGTASPVVFIEQDNSGDDQPALSIQQDSTSTASIRLVQNGNTCNLIVDADGTCDSGTAMVTDNSIAICAVCS